MKAAWRELLSKVAIGCVTLGAVTTTVGCQSWSLTNLGVPTGTRVPPPPTGTVQPQGAYYNNPGAGTSAAPAKVTSNTPSTAAPVVQASSTDPFGGNASMPATNLSSTAGEFSTNAISNGVQGASGQVNTADYNDNGSGIADVVTAGALQGGAAFQSNADEGASLQWTGK